MNLAEYRRTIRDAYREYGEVLQNAADSLQKKLMVAEGEFFGEEKIAVPEDVPARRRDRDDY